MAFVFWVSFGSLGAWLQGLMEEGVSWLTGLAAGALAAIGAVKNELGPRWAVAVFALQCGVAWITAFVVRIVGTALGFA